MKYPYTAVANPRNPQQAWHRRPIVTLEVCGPSASFKVTGLIDSGADTTLMDVSIATVLGINLTDANKHVTYGIDGKPHEIHETEVAIQVDKLNQITIPVSFMENLPVPCLLGQEGFFDAYRIKFERDHKTFELVPVRV